MELGKQIKHYRQQMQLSQEELAGRVYVSRQTISNWENDKSYPDVNSLVLLGEVFQISLDKLIKGDLDAMKAVVETEDVVRLKRYGTVYTLLLAAVILLAVPLFFWLGMWAFIPWGILYAITMTVAFKIDRLKKRHDIQTYKEILAFSQGRLLDDLQKQWEIGKRPYQKVFLVAGVMLVALAVCAFAAFIFSGM